MSSKEKIIFLTYFVAGMIINNITVGLPLFFAASGYEKSQIATLTAVLFLGSMAQPLIGYVCDVTGKKQLVVKSLFLGMGMVAICMTFNREFYVMIFLAFLISVFKDPVIGLLDDITIRYTNSIGANYGKLRSGASWGYALGLFALIPFSYLLKNSETLVPVLTLIPMLSIVFLGLQAMLGDISVGNNLRTNTEAMKENAHLYKKEIKEKLLSKTYILLILINLLINGTSNAKSSYQSLLLQSFGATILILSVSNFISIIPEFAFMPRMGLWLRKFSLKKVMSIVATVSITFNVLLSIAPNSTFIVSIVWLHGLMMSIFIPIYYVKLRTYLGENISSTGMLLNAMLQNLGSFFIGILVIKPIYSNFGFTQLFMAVVVINLIAFIPISMLNKDI